MLSCIVECYYTTYILLCSGSFPIENTVFQQTFPNADPAKKILLILNFNLLLSNTKKLEITSKPCPFLSCSFHFTLCKDSCGVNVFTEQQLPLAWVSIVIPNSSAQYLKYVTKLAAVSSSKSFCWNVSFYAATAFP